MDDFERELKQSFLEEAAALIDESEGSFLQLEQDPNNKSIIEKIFRLAHNIKGSSRAVGFNDLGAFTHEYENVLSAIKKGELSANAKLVSLLLKANDHLKNFVQSLKADYSAAVDSSALVAELKSAQQGHQSLGQPANPSDSPTLQGETSAESFTEEHTTLSSPTAVNKKAVVSQADESIRISVKKIDSLANYLGEIVIHQGVLHEQTKDSSSALLKRTVQQLSKITREVQDIALSLRLVPVKPLFQKLSRTVRDTASILGKEIDFITSGEEAEIDKTLIELISDPLVHIVRNAVDHGIEDGMDRVTAGKNLKGRVELKAYQKADRLVFEIIDDGKGLDPEKLVAKAKEKGLLPSNAKPSREESLELIFMSGFSTKAQASEISGRGVGMDVARTNIEALQGDLHIDSEVGRGSKFVISLPMTLSIIDGLLLRSGSQLFVAPISQIDETIRLNSEIEEKRTGLGSVVKLRGEVLPLFELDKALRLTSQQVAGERPALIIRSALAPFALTVDEIVGQSQVVIKDLGPELSHLKQFSGSAILGNGRPALILELPELYRSLAA